jgi:hypothetical protein
MQAHRLGVAAGQHQGGTLAVQRADRAKDIGRDGALVFWRCRPRADQCPSARDLVFLPNSGFIAEPDFYVGGIDALLACDLVQQGGETLLKRSMAPSRCA